MSDVIAVFPIEREDSLICHGAALRKATRRVSQLYDAVLAPCGLKVSQHSILSHIARAGAPSMTDLARLLVLDRSALAHNLKPLVRDGYVRTTRDLRDGRSRRVALTDAGCEADAVAPPVDRRAGPLRGRLRRRARRRVAARWPRYSPRISRWRSAGARDGRGQRLMVSAP